jgi:hypothetical protein
MLDSPAPAGRYTAARDRLVQDHIDVTDYVVREIDGL